MCFISVSFTAATIVLCGVVPLFLLLFFSVAMTKHNLVAERQQKGLVCLLIKGGITLLNLIYEFFYFHPQV